MSTHGRHLEIMTSNRKSVDSVSRCVFTRGTILPNFILIRFETTELSAFLGEVVSARRTTTCWVTIWDPFLIQECSFIVCLHGKSRWSCDDCTLRRPLRS